jgi:hypothetical protein
MSRTDDVRVVNPHETAIVSGYRDPRLVGVSEIFPIVEVGKERGSYTEYGPDASILRQGLEQPLGAGRPSIDVTIAKGDFACVKMGVNVPYYDEERNEAANPEQLGEKKSKLGQSTHLMFMENAIAQYCSNSANFDPAMTEALVGTARWDDFTNSDPVSDMVRWLSNLELRRDREQDELSIGLGPAVWNKIRLHPKLKVTLANGDTRPATKEDVAAKVGCKEIKILRGKYAVTVDRKDPRNTIFAHLWGKIALVYEALTAPSMDDPLWGCIVREKGFPEVTEYRDNEKDADIKAVKDKWGVHVRANNRAFLGTTIIT